MKFNTCISVGLASLLALSSPMLFAETKLPEDNMPMSKVLNKLKENGFVIIKEIEFDDGVYKAKTVSAHGKDDKISFNPKTGELKGGSDKNPNTLSTLDIAVKLEGQGFTKIYKMDMESDGKFEIKALNKDGKRTKLEVDGKTGNILKQKED